jgi:hypothetical protein
MLNIFVCFFFHCINRHLTIDLKDSDLHSFIANRVQDFFYIKNNIDRKHFNFQVFNIAVTIIRQHNITFVLDDQLIR